MKIGVDFDNTIVSYDTIFSRAARDQGLIPEGVALSKQAVRDYLREHNREDDWTELQGYVYGARMVEAEPFAGVIEFFISCRQHRVPVYIISHKTRYPFRGPRYDLHQSALQWLEQHGFFTGDRVGLSRGQVFFEFTKEEKKLRIAQAGCTHFIDDLPEFLLEPDFPAQVRRILFDPHRQAVDRDNKMSIVASWDELLPLIKDSHGGD